MVVYSRGGDGDRERQRHHAAFVVRRQTAVAFLILCIIIITTCGAIHQAQGEEVCDPHSGWSTLSVADWLTREGLDNLASQFANEAIDGKQLNLLANHDLTRLIPNTNDRARFEEALKRLLKPSSSTITELESTAITDVRIAAPSSSLSSSVSSASTAPPVAMCGSHPAINSSCPCFAAQSNLSKESIELLNRLAQRYPMTPINQNTDTDKEEHQFATSIGVGSDGCSRQLSRLFTRRSDRPSARRRKLFFILGADRETREYFVKTYPFFDIILVDTSRTFHVSPHADPNAIHGYLRVASFMHLPCILREFNIRPHVIYVQHQPGRENLQLFTHIFDSTSRTPKSARHPSSAPCLCHNWWQPEFWLGLMPSILGTQPPLDQYDGYLNHLASVMKRRIYVDQPCWSLASRDIGAGCLDEASDATTPNHPLLGVYMIVKNEASGIGETLDSALPIVDRISILDTGSTDDTVQIIEDRLDDSNDDGRVQGRVHRGPFVDFSTTRNHALQLMASTYPEVEFVLMLNGDDTIVGGGALRKFLLTRRHLCGPSEEMYLLSVDYEGYKVNWSERLLRLSAIRRPSWPNPSIHWHYTGLTHEVLTHPVYSSPNTNVAISYVGRVHQNIPFLIGGGRFGIRHVYHRESEEQKRWRNEQDLVLLQQDLRRQPKNERTIYYLARTYDQMGDHSSALHWFDQRLVQLLQRAQLERRRRHIPNHVLDESTLLESDGRIQPSLMTEGNDDECYALLRRAKLHVRLQRARSLTVRAFAEGMALCPKVCELPYYLAEYYLSLSPPTLLGVQQSARWLKIADEISRVTPSMMESLVSKQFIAELKKQIQLAQKAIKQ